MCPGSIPSNAPSGTSRREIRLREDTLEAISDIRVHIDLANLELTSRGPVVGVIWIGGSDNALAFPEVGWSDFPVALLGTWIPALRRLSTRGQAAECHFMDGPYHFTVSSGDAGEWRVACFETREAPSVTNAVAEWSTAADALLESAVSAGKSLLGHCDTRGWWNDETDRLREALAFTDPERTN